MYSAVQDKSANYTVVAGDAGDLIRVTTTSGAVTITLPTISTVGDGFKVAIVKWTSDGNAVSVVRSSTNTINGATSYNLGNQYSSATFVADLETGQWFAVASGLGVSNVAVDAFSGNNSTVAFTLSGDPGSENNTQVYVSGVYQEKDTYSVSGTTLTFSTAPPTGTSNIEVVWTAPLAIGTPSDGTVTTAKLASTTGSGAVVLATSPTITTPVISSLSSASATALTLQSAGTTAVTIDTSQNVGIGGTPVKKLSILPTSIRRMDFYVRDPGVDDSLVIRSQHATNNNIRDMILEGNNVKVFTGADSGGSGTESMRIANDGTVRIGTTSDIGGKLSVDCTTGNSFGAIVKSNTSGGAALAVNAQSPCTTHVQWYNSGTPTGTVTTNGASAVSYNTTSDYRLKENIAPMTGALAKVAQLKPCTYKWKLDGANGQGFIAHELQAIVPDCVTGEKDAVDANGNPKYQGIDTSYLVATLTAAIQELKQINDTQAETINALTARVVALEK
jgi:hypothetical protein